MPDLFSIFSRWKKFIFLLALGAAMLALLISILLPKKYLSVATAIPSNAVLADKGHLFNKNIESLYPEYGSPDDLDRLLGTAELDTLYLSLAEGFRLVQHYEIKSNKHSLHEAAQMLRKNTEVSKSGFGELKIKVWDEDSVMAARLANQYLQELEAMHQHLQDENNSAILQKIRKTAAEKETALELPDTASGSVSLRAMKQKNLVNELQQYQELISEYEMAIKTHPAGLLVVESARPAMKPDQPHILLLAIFTFGAVALFAFFAAVFWESRR